jgi:hypothetical protein
MNVTRNTLTHTPIWPAPLRWKRLPEARQSASDKGTETAVDEPIAAAAESAAAMPSWPRIFPGL